VIDLDELQKKLKAIADTVNSFKSEAVQLRVVDVLLGHLGASEAPAPGSTAGSTRTPKKSRRQREKASASSLEAEAEVSRRSSRTSGSPGASATINELLGSGFFKEPRTIGFIVDHCRTARGHHYKANECSPALLRLLRDKKLKRQKNKEGQYEYTQA
jgi:hypothetical protein